MRRFDRVYSVAYLVLGWVAFRFLLLDMTQMREWPTLLAIIGMILVGVSLKKNYSSVARCASLGYVVSFLIGYLLQKDGLDAGGGRTNNMWLIWTISYFVIIAYGIYIEYKRRHPKR